jgi:hypothetical protein
VSRAIRQLGIATRTFHRSPPLSWQLTFLQTDGHRQTLFVGRIQTLGPHHSLVSRERLRLAERTKNYKKCNQEDDVQWSKKLNRKF